MSGESPDVVLYSSDGIETTVQNGVATPTGTRGLMISGSDGTNSRFILIDGSARQVMVGAGTAGTPVGGVVSIQGVSGGTAIPVTSTQADLTATGTLNALNASVQIATAGYSSVGFQLAAGTLIGTIVTETSFDGGATWNTTVFNDASTNANTTSIVFASSNTATAKTLVGVGGSGLTRVRVSAYTSGTAAATLRASTVRDPSLLTTGPAGTALPPVVSQMGGSVTTTAPTYTTGTLNPLSLTTAGLLRVDASGTTQGISGTVTANQGTANTVANAWTAKITDGTNTASVKPSSTYAATTDSSLVVTLSPNLNPAVPTTSPQLTVIHNNATLTASGSLVIQNVGKKEVTIGVTVNGAVSGTTPQLIYTVEEIDPINLTTQMTFPGYSITLPPATGTGSTYYEAMTTFSPAVKVIWTVSTGASFAGVDAWLTVKDPSTTYGLTYNNVLTPLSAVNVDLNNNTMVAGAVAAGLAVSGAGAPILTGGSDGTNVRTILTDSTGRTIIVGAGTAGTATGGVLTVQGVSGATPIIVTPSSSGFNTTAAQGSANTVANGWPVKHTDGTNTQAVKAASTAAAATDPAAVVAMSPNSPLPAGTNAIGTVTATQATASALNATVVGSGTAGTPTGGVLTVQGITGGTAIPVTSTPAGDLVTTGTLGALNAAITLTTAGYAGVGIQIAAGTLIGTIVAETSFDNSVWNATGFNDAVTGNNTANIVFGSANTATGKTIIGTGGAGYVRVRVSAYTSGTANATMRASVLRDPSTQTSGAPGSALPLFVGMNGGSVTTAAPTYTTGTLNPLSLTTAGALRVDASATTQPVSISGGTLTIAQGTPNTVANGWPIKITDGTNTAPTGDVPSRAGYERITDGTNTGTVKAASTAAASTDTALVVALHPTSPLPAGTNTIGAVTQASGPWTVTGTGTAGTPAAGIVTIQGNASGTPIPITGTISATNPSVSTVATTPPTSATYVGGSVTTAAPSYTTGQMNPLSLTTAGALRVDASATTQPVSIASSVTVAQTTAANLNATVVGTVTSNQGNPNTLISNAWPHKLTDGTNVQAVKAASTAAASTDPAAVVALSPNSPLPAGTNVIGAVTQSGGPWTVSGTVTAANASVAATAATAPTSATLSGGTVSASSPSYTAGQMDPLSLTTAGALRVDGSAVTQPVSIASGLTITQGAPNTVANGWPIKITDGTNTAPTGDVPARAGYERITDGTNTAAVKAASTAAVATDPALVVAISPNNPITLSGSLNQGTPNTVANGWPVKVTDGTNTMPTADVAARAQFHKITDGTNTAAVKAASTYAAATDPSLVVTLSPNLNPAVPTTSPQLTVIHNSASVTTSGSIVIQNIGKKEITIGATVNGAVTGATPALVYSMAEIDPINLSTLMTFPGYSITLPALNSTGATYYEAMTTFSPAVLVSWTCSGTFAGVDAWVTVKDPSTTYGLDAAGVLSPLAAVNIDANSNTTAVLRDANNNPIAIQDSKAMVAGTQQGLPIIGQSSGVGRLLKVNRLGMAIPGNQNLMAADFIEGTNINTFVWTDTVTTMTAAQTTGLLTQNSGTAGTITTANTANVLTTNKQFPLISQTTPVSSFKALLTQTTNATAELGFGAPTGITAIVPNGAFFRIQNSGQVKVVVSSNSTETVSAVLATLTLTSFYIFYVSITDSGARFIIEDNNGIPILDTSLSMPLATAAPAAAVSHVPAFSRLYIGSTAAGVAPKIAIASFQAWLYGVDTSKPWAEQLAGTGKSSNVSPTLFTQTLQSSGTANPTSSTPVSTTCTWATLGGEFSINMTATSANYLGIFGYAVPAPYSLCITEVLMQNPTVTTTFSATATALQFTLMVANSNNPSTAAGFRYPLGTFGATASAAVGTALTGLPINLFLKTPIVVLPGQYVMIMVKVISGAATGVYFGSILINGYYE